MTTRLLLYMVTLTVITATAFTSSDKISFHVGLLSTSEVSDLELDAYRRVVNVTPVVFPRHENNVSFYGLMEDLQEEFLNPQTVAIIGSGDPVVDGVASLFAACTGVPLVNARHSPEMSRVPYSLNFVGPFADERASAVVGLVLHLGCSHIAMIASLDKKRTQITQQVKEKAGENGLSYELFSISHAQSTFDLVRVAGAIVLQKRNGYVMFVFDCDPDDAEILIRATQSLVNFQWGKYVWVVLGEFIEFKTAIDKLPFGVLGIYLNFSETDLLHEALKIIKRSIRRINLNGTLVYDKDCVIQSPLQKRHRRIIRRTEEQVSTGKKEFLELRYGTRTDTKYKIARIHKGHNGTPEWDMVGYTEGLRVKLQPKFWLEGKRVPSEGKIKVVTIADYPLVLISRHKLEVGQVCVFGHPCVNYVSSEEFVANDTTRNSAKHCCGGFLIDIILWLERDLGIEFDLFMVEDGKYGTFDRETKQWNGMIRVLMDGKADMALASLTINSEREKVVSFSHPFGYEDLKILISSKSVDSYNLGTGFLNPFEVILWIASLLMVHFILGIVWLMERLSPYGHYHRGYGREKNAFNLTVCMSYIWSGVFKLQLEDVMPKSSSARFTAAVFSFATLVLTTSYTANLAASVVSSEVELPVTGIRDPKFQNPPPGFTFATLAHSSVEGFFIESENPQFRQIGQIMKPHGVKTVQEGIEKVHSGELDAFIYSSPFLEVAASRIHGCPFYILDKPINRGAHALAFTRGSPWERPISRLIEEYQDREYFRDLENKWFRTECMGRSNLMTKAHRLNIQHFGGLFLFCFAICPFIYLLLLFMESLWYWKHRKIARKYVLDDDGQIQDGQIQLGNLEVFNY